MIIIKRLHFISFIAAFMSVIMLSSAAFAYNIVDLPDSMQLDEALGIFSASDITRATISNYNDRKYVELTRDEIEDIYKNIKSITVYREENPVPFRGTTLNLYTGNGIKCYYVNSGLVLGRYGNSNYICYDSSGEDAVYMTNIETKYQEAENKTGSDDIPRTGSYDFLNLPAEQWGYAPVNEAAARNLLPYEFTHKYTDSISREEFCILLGRLICSITNYNNLEDYVKNQGISYLGKYFIDCEGKDNSIDVLYALGIVSGKSDMLFDPDGTISRQEAAAVLCRTAEKFMYIETWSDLGFADSDYIAPWAKYFVIWVNEQNIMNGVEGRFMPNESITVLQAITSVNRTYKVLQRNINY